MPTDLWRFAEALYQRPGVEAACLLLQTQGADVCLLLCAAWLETRKIACNDERVTTLKNLAQPWQQQVVVPLRQLRQSWREQAQSDKALRQLREQIKQLELEAEREQRPPRAASPQDGQAGAPAAPLNGREGWPPQPGTREALQPLPIAA